LGRSKQLVFINPIKRGTTENRFAFLYDAITPFYTFRICIGD
jgi:hypothetical protein